MEQFTIFLQRVFLSKKLFYAAVPIFANLIAKLTKSDLTDTFILVLDTVFALLLIIQGLLDIRFGSASDGTGAIVVAPPDATVVKANPLNGMTTMKVASASRK